MCNIKRQPKTDMVILPTETDRVQRAYLQLQDKISIKRTVYADLFRIRENI